MRTKSYVRWHLAGPVGEDGTKMFFKVVRITETVEDLAGPFASVRAAEKWMDDQRRQPTLTGGEEIPEAGCSCPCHDAVQPGLVPCPNCAGHSSRRDDG